MTEPAADTADPSAADAPDAPAPQPSSAAAAPSSPLDELPEKVQKEIRDLRQENASRRAAATHAQEAAARAEQRQQELLDNMAKALGLKSDDTPPDPAALQQSLAERENRIAATEADLRAKDVELAAWRSASKQGANAVALLDSRSFVAEVGKLDPTTDDFAAQLDAAVKRALEANPALRATPLPTPGQAGIGVTGLGPAANVQPGLDRVRHAYATSTPNS